MGREAGTWVVRVCVVSTKDRPNDNRRKDKVLHVTVEERRTRERRRASCFRRTVTLRQSAHSPTSRPVRLSSTPTLGRVFLLP